MKKNIKKISIWRILVYFIIYSFIGFFVETLFALINYNVLESRKSFLYGPFCGIYGIGAVIFILVLRYFNKNNYTLFFSGCIVGAITEYTISFIGEKMFNVRWWDYSGKFLNINGRICLLYSLFWEILSLVLIKIITPQVDRFIDFIKLKVDRKMVKIIISVFTLFMIINAILSTIAMQLFLVRIIAKNNLKVENKMEIIEKYRKIYSNEKQSKFIYKFWGDEKMIKTYPNITLKQTDGSVIYIRDLIPNVKPYIYKFYQK